MLTPPVITGFAAVLFDLDGVITDTASLHAAAWKSMFDEFLEERSNATLEPFTPFSIEEDYRRFVDGKPRYDGVRAFLASRGIELPEGSSQDGPELETVRGLGNKKNASVVRLIDTRGVDVYPGAVRLVDHLTTAGIPMAIVSSSANARAALESAGLIDRFTEIVDGVVAAERGLAGKPAPDAFLLAADLLQVAADSAVVVEDALAGVEAGRRGGFGLVVGVDRLDQEQALLDGGADIVVKDLSTLVPELPT